MDVGLFFRSIPMDIMETWFRTQSLFSTSCLPIPFVCHVSVAISHMLTSFQVHEASPLLSATRSACRSNQVVAGDWRLHVHGSALSLWCWNCVQNGRLMWHLLMCGEWFA